MLHCMNLTGDMTVYMLERQRERMKSEEEEQGYFSGTAFNINGVFSSSSSCSSPLHHVHESMMVAADSGSALAEVVAQARSMNMNMNMNMPTAPGFDVTFSCLPATDSSTRKDTSKKRKPDKPRNSKFVAENDRKDKRIKVGADDGESKNSTNTNSNANNGETCADTSNSQQKSKASEVQKPDFIHVRARRGQATDSHSLAERVRREKISERMKYLQDLVPGCNKITGKAGMLDEIINYVQSLQRQVEFLSMKLATVNPRLDFSVDDVFEKEVFSACRANFPNIGMESDMTNPAYLQFNSPQQIVSYGGLDNASDMGLRRTIGASVSMPETHLHSSCFNQQMLPPSSTWEGDFQNLCNLDFDQARGTSFPSQLFSGLVEAGNLKMEM